MAYHIWIGSYAFGLLFFVVMIVNLFRIRKFLKPSLKIFQKTYPSKADIMSLNLNKNNSSIEKVINFLSDTKPDILVLLELTGKHENALKPILQNYSYKKHVKVRDGFMLAVFSKLELQNSVVTYHGFGKTPLIKTAVTLKGQNCVLFAGHPKPALKYSWAKERILFFKSIEDDIAKEQKPVIIAGDFNSVPWEHHFKMFLERTNMVSALCSLGLRTTWPSRLSPFGIAMDNILVSESIAVGVAFVGPHVGSDHRPVCVSL